MIFRRGNRVLSPWRFMLGLVLLAGAGYGSAQGVQQYLNERSTVNSKPWFASYVDVTSTPRYAFEELGATEHKDAVLSFIVALPGEACTPSWGGAYTMAQATGALDLDRRIERLRQQDGNVAVSFGGLLNDELATVCTDKVALKGAYKSVIDKYKIDTIDLDLEKANLSNVEAAERRGEVIAELQKERRAAGKNLAVWVTLPVAPQGLTDEGAKAVSVLLAKGVDVAGVNVMTMDYGQSREGKGMQEASELALKETHRQLGVIYKLAGKELSSGTLWKKIGATPMIGQNDERDEVFGLDDAKGFNKYANARGIGRMSMWSANRDRACGSNYVDVKAVSDSCSGVKQQIGEFAQILGEGFKGNLKHNAGAVTKADGPKEPVKDDPKTAPYPIWSANAAYLEGTKVVWRGNVYRAKWYTNGDLPDNPVLNAWQTPWELVGPVLPGETPIPQPTLAPGTFPEWNGETAYEAGMRVQYKGVPYQAKWWTKGESPDAASANFETAGWQPLTQRQIEAILQSRQ
jgi:chitinase